MILTYLLKAEDDADALRRGIGHLQRVTPLAREQWEIRVVFDARKSAVVQAMRGEFPDVQFTAQGPGRGPGAMNVAIDASSGQFIIPIMGQVYPAGREDVGSMIGHLKSDSAVGAVVGSLFGPDLLRQDRGLPTLARIGLSCFCKSALERVQGLPRLDGIAADYDISFKILSARSRIERRQDIHFRDQTPAAEEVEDDSVDVPQGPDESEILDHLTVAVRCLPPKLARIYFQDWSMKYLALARNAGTGMRARLAILRTSLRALVFKFTDPEPVSQDVLEAVFAFRGQGIAIGEWARRANAWRIVLADFSDNLWSAYNACLSSGLQLRCVVDNHAAYEDLIYHELPIVPSTRAFEGGGIDGVIITSTDPAQIETTFKSIRAHFHGPILKLHQAPMAATHVQAIAA
jgi:hypothetical protein